MLAKGLETQLSAAVDAEKRGVDAITTKYAEPNLYNAVMNRMRQAYTKVWDIIETNEEHLSEEV